MKIYEMTLRAVGDPNRLITRFRAWCGPCDWRSEPWGAPVLAKLEYHHGHLRDCKVPPRRRDR